MDLRKYQQKANDYDHLSLRDLLDARDLYHIHLMRHPNVVATAIGRYRIRIEDDWPTEKGTGYKGTGERTLANSEVRPYSWPCVLAFVDTWEDESEFGAKGKYDPDALVPKTLYLPDGRRVPVCVVRAPRELETEQRVPAGITFPTNNIGGGFPIIADVQGREHIATIACLVSDGHRVYALTNRHVTGAAGEVLRSQLNGKRTVIGRTAAGSCDRLTFSTVYAGWPGDKVNVNIDAGLIDIDNLDRWSAKIRDIGIVGPLADLAVDNFTLSMTGCRVRAFGAASGLMLGEIAALFYRYKSVGGFEFVADFLIGPRATRCFGSDQEGPGFRAPQQFVTHPGDSGALWLLEPMSDAAEAVATLSKKPAAEAEKERPALMLPLAMQWGAHVLDSPGAGAQTYVLATCLSTICRELRVDVIRDWNLDQADTWGAVGHFAIASRTAKTISKTFPRLQQLLENNAAVITHDDDTILTSEFKHQGDAKFVALADVPDFFWKHGHQGASRPGEGPNHFADMDHFSAELHADLLKLCEKPENIDADVWDQFYDTVDEILTGKPIEQKYRGLLPFRVWQIFDEMIDFAAGNDHESFACAAGVLAHYVGDACQPLHISFLHDGDPRDPTPHVVHHRNNGGTETVQQPRGLGVHAAYEDEMVNAHRKEILKGLDKTPKAAKDDLVANGFDAAQRTIALMRLAFKEIAPTKLVNAYVQHKQKAGRADAFWKLFGTPTIKCMQAGTHLLAVLVQNAWRLGDGEKKVKSLAALTQKRAMEICRSEDFLRSYMIGQIGEQLHRPGE
jgi:hypothetical protein